MNVLAVIPARYASMRFPGKPLAKIFGKPMVQHVWERCRQSETVNRVIVATEDNRIVDACRNFGAEAELTSTAHLSGTDRVAEIAERYPAFDTILNIQGDEPGISPRTITAVVRILGNPAREIATAISVLDDPADLSNPNVVKVVTARDSQALYFSRSGIPFHRDGKSSTKPVYYRHQGIYGFQRDVLLKVTKIPPAPLEIAESLEQLRWLQSGLRIHCAVVEDFSIGIDTPADLQTFEQSHHPIDE